MTDGKLRFLDRLYVFMLVAAIVALAWRWRFDSVPPDLVESLSAAADLRPPTGPFSNLWLLVAGPLCRSFGIQTACVILRVAGHLALGVMALIAVDMFGMLLPASLRRGEHVAAWWRTAVRFVLFQGTALFCLSEPVWNAFRWFSPLSLQVLLAAFASICLVLHIRTDNRAPLFASFFLFGILSADAPMGVVLLVVGFVAFRMYVALVKGGVVTGPSENPLRGALMSWRLTLALILGLSVGCAAEAYAFSSHDGLEAFGWTWGDYMLEAPLAYVKTLVSACTPVGVALIVFAAIFPVAIEFTFIRRATDDERHLSYGHGLIFATLGIAAFSQLTGARALWFWTWGGGAGCVSDGILKCVVMFLFALLVVWSLAVFTTELYLRNFRRIETLRFPDAAEAAGAAEALATARRLQRVVRACLLVEPIVAFMFVLPFRGQGMEHAMLDVVADAVRETSEECRGADYLFTDGGLDAAVELAAAASGRSLCALSMMGGAENSREIYLRTRKADNAADRALLESGAADALRTWVRSHPGKAGKYAVQIGFELWRRLGKPMPECAGLVARQEGFSPEEAACGAAAGRALAKRLLVLYEHGDPAGIADRALRDAFVFTQWRLAVIARHRANAYDERKMSDLAMEETRLADALDKNNGALARIRATMAWASRRKLERMTPYEGLDLGLARADFALARVFALRILDVSPDDPAANFALGMDFFVQKQYSRAETYLKRCLVRRPDDPAVLNNIAQCRLRQGDPSGAQPYAKRALEILPNSPEVRRTVERIKLALESQKPSDKTH